MKLVIVLIVALASGRAVADPEPRSLVVLASSGVSFALGERRVANAAAPAAELRLGWRIGRTCPPVIVEASAIGYALPERVLGIALGVRLHPFPALPVARHLYVRASAQALASRGSDVAPGVETGMAISGGRLIGWLGIGADRFLIRPRALVQGHVGVGVTF